MGLFRKAKSFSTCIGNAVHDSVAHSPNYFLSMVNLLDAVSTNTAFCALLSVAGDERHDHDTPFGMARGQRGATKFANKHVANQVHDLRTRRIEAEGSSKPIIESDSNKSANSFFSHPHFDGPELFDFFVSLTNSERERLSPNLGDFLRSPGCTVSSSFCNSAISFLHLMLEELLESNARKRWGPKRSPDAPAILGNPRFWGAPMRIRTVVLAILHFCCVVAGPMLVLSLLYFGMPAHAHV